MMNNTYCVIMAGGVGSRFWPMSTASKPKQFLDVLGIGKTLIQMTYERMLTLTTAENIYVLTNKSYAKIVKEQLPELGIHQILTEPERKNTAPCIAYAAAKIYSINRNATLVISPADQLILKENRFKEIVSIAIETATEKTQLITLGIQPNRPDTGYGYIQFSKTAEKYPGAILTVEQFKEKPDAKTAEMFIKEGNYYWNSGIFIWKASTVLDAIKKYEPELHDLFAKDLNAYGNDNEQDKVDYCFKKCKDISIDYAVMEHAQNVVVVLADFDWSDLGTWGSIHTHLKKDSKNNAIIGQHAHLFNSSNCLVNVPNDKLVLIDGLNDYIVVESDEMLMILKADNEQQLKEYIKEVGIKSPDFFNEKSRPLGS